MSILRKLFGLAPKKTEEPTLDLTARQEKINASPAIAAAAEAPTAPAPAPAYEADDGALTNEQISQIVAPAGTEASIAAPVATKARKTAASKAPRAKKTKK
jgi:hypothetical protein